MVNTYHWIARQGLRSIYMNGKNMTMDFIIDIDIFVSVTNPDFEAG